MKCNNCGSEIIDNETECKKCNLPIKDEIIEKSKSIINKIIKIIFGFILVALFIFGIPISFTTTTKNLDEYNAITDSNATLVLRKSDYSEYPIVKHYFDITDEIGNPILNSVNSEDFIFYEVYENNKIKINNVEVSKISQGAKSSIDIVADLSGSIGKNGLELTKNSLKSFLDVVEFDNHDEVELVSFSDSITTYQRFTTNKNSLVKSIDEFNIGGQTPLYDALYDAIKHTVVQRGSKMIIATTDGKDNRSIARFNEVISLAQQYEIPIYIVGVGTDINVNELTQISQQTGGKFIRTKNFDDLQKYFENIYNIEKNGLVISYNVNDFTNVKSDILLQVNDENFKTESLITYDPIFVSWGGNNRVDDEQTPYDERIFDSNYYDDTHTYEVVFEDVTWSEANQKAKEKGGYLARITSEDEFDVVTNEIKKATTSQSYLYWLGGSRENSIDEKYTWVDSDLNVMSETLPDDLWLEGEPTYYAVDENGNHLFEEKYLNMFYVAKFDKWVLNDVTDDLINGYGQTYEGSIAYVIEYEK